MPFIEERAHQAGMWLQNAFKEDPFVKWTELRLEYEEVEVTDEDEAENEEDGNSSERGHGDEDMGA